MEIKGLTLAPGILSVDTDTILAAGPSSSHRVSVELGFV